MKLYVWILLAALSLPAFAHDEGHGAKVSDAGKQGGVVAPVIDAKDIKKGAKAPLVHKSELVRSEDGTVRVYFYDQEMNPLPLTAFAQEAKGFLEFKKGKKWLHQPFTFKQEEGAFVGKAPKASTKPFNIDIRVKAGDRELLAAFTNLD